VFRIDAAVLFGLAVVGVACSSPLTPGDLAGRYHATQFDATFGGTPYNLLARGATVTLELRDDGTTAGHFSLPVVPGFQSVPVEDDLAGTYEVRNNTVRLLTTDASAYLAGFYFNASKSAMSTNETSASASFLLTLER
jgi:hypothetical protein